MASDKFTHTALKNFMYKNDPTDLASYVEVERGKGCSPPEGVAKDLEKEGIIQKGYTPPK